MSDLNDRLTLDGNLRTRLQKSLTAYVAHRDSYEVIDGDIPGGGPDRVKCLHAHVAHELAGGANPAGAWALADTGHPDCIEPCFALTPDGSSR
jgi:hypothetical protein